MYVDLNRWELNRYSDWLQAGRRGGGGGVNNILFSTASRPVLGPTQPLIQWGTGRALSPGVKRPGYEADHSPPTSAEVKNTWIYTSTPPYALMAYGGVLN
jgi:hypothetical protein